MDRAVRPHAAFAAALVVLVALAYLPGRHGGYAFDDFPNIVDNVALHVTTLDWSVWLAATLSSPASELQRPLAMLTFAANHYFTGLDPAPMKLTSLAIHLVNSLLVFALARRMLALSRTGDAGRRAWAARFVAAAWALHPINLMAVLFIVQRMESLSHVFVFAGLWLYLSGRQRQMQGRNGWSLILLGLLGGTVLGALSKESAVLLPLYACLLELLLPGLGGLRRDRSLQVLFVLVLFLPAVLGIAWLLPRALAPDGGYGIRHYDMTERLLTEGRVLLDYLQWSVLPPLDELSLYHDDYPVSRGPWNPPTTTFALAGLALLAGLAWRIRRRRPLTSLGVLLFLGAHSLTATFLPLELVYEHRNYFASFGICLALSDLLLLAPRAVGLRRVGCTLALLAVLAFAATTHLRAREWSDPYRFASSEAAKHPDSPRATYALGQALVVMGGYRHDSPLLVPARDALERARRTPRSGILPNSALLLLAANTGLPQQDEWWLDMQRKLRHDPIGPQEINALGSLSRCASGRVCDFPPQQIISTFESALAHGPNDAVLMIYGDYALRVLHDPASTLAMWKEAAAMNPRMADYQANLIRLLIATGRNDEALIQIRTLRELGSFGQHKELANALESQIEDQ